MPICMTGQIAWNPARSQVCVIDRSGTSRTTRVTSPALSNTRLARWRCLSTVNTVSGEYGGNRHRRRSRAHACPRGFSRRYRQDGGSSPRDWPARRHGRLRCRSAGRMPRRDSSSRSGNRAECAAGSPVLPTPLRACPSGQFLSRPGNGPAHLRARHRPGWPAWPDC